MPILSFSPEVLPPARAARLGFFAAVTLALMPAWLCASEAPVAVFTETFNDYQRTRLPDQSFKAETYAFGEGGTFDEPDTGEKKLTFMQVARAAALPLAHANYVPTRNPNEAGLFILVYWGRTLGSREAVGPSNTAFAQPGGPIDKVGASDMGPSRNATPAGGLALAAGALFDSSAAAQAALIDQYTLDAPRRDWIDDKNGRILGYSEVIQRARALPMMTMMMRRDVLDEVAANRYYVVLLAYDFRLAWKEKKLKPLWSARISVEEDGNGLDKSLGRMLATASQLFGQNSGGLRRDFVRDGRVITSSQRVIEYLPPTK